MSTELATTEPTSIPSLLQSTLSEQQFKTLPRQLSLATTNWTIIGSLTEATARGNPVPPRPADVAAIEDLLARLDKRETKPTDAQLAAKFITGCYRAKDFVDPMIFALALVRILSRRPPVVVAMAMDPERGIPGRIKFAPQIEEVSKELDKIEHTVRLVADGVQRAQKRLGLVVDANRAAPRVAAE